MRRGAGDQLPRILNQNYQALTGNSSRFLQKVNRILNTPRIQLTDYQLFKEDLSDIIRHHPTPQEADS
jgi:hypothetical protein